MAKGKEELGKAALPVGETILGFDVFRWFLQVLDSYGRWDTAVSLSNHLPPFFSGLWFTPISLVLGLMAIVIYVQRRTASPSSLIYDINSKEIPSKTSWKWLWVTCFVFLGSCGCAAVYAGVWLDRYEAPPIHTSSTAPYPPMEAYENPPTPHLRSSTNGPQPRIEIQATTNAPNSAAVGVNTGTVNVNPPVNPNSGTTTYDCAGLKKWTGQTPEAAFTLKIDPDEQNGVVSMMATLNNSKQYGELLYLCSQKMKSAPDWLTPYLFCSLGDFEIGNYTEAKSLFAHYEEKRGTAYNAPTCNHIHDFLQSNLPRF